AGGPISLGNLLAGETLDLEFEFHLAGGSLAGDYNADGTVDAADYTVWRNNLGAPAGTLPNDTAGGPIGAGQYLAWKANFGASPSAPSKSPSPPRSAYWPWPRQPWGPHAGGCGQHRNDATQKGRSPRAAGLRPLLRGTPTGWRRLGCPSLFPPVPEVHVSPSA